MGELIVSAVELPRTQKAVSNALSQVLEMRDTKDSAVSFVSDTLTDPGLKHQVAAISRDTLEAIVNDPEVQMSLWQFMKKTLLPKWIHSEKPAPETSAALAAWTHKRKVGKLEKIR
eukprot:Gregarina_sp_Poly_1__7696@NODE_433_length_8455_cov_489_751192_g353_i0_p5_GENE_NODE_433_length_8455_cov_489_751192_g353_i0NODE_433_length_8455_cov_489_751192_g353_i0_p5_ORF_typecomplete_len127_score31_29GerD/PF17898_1/0_006Gly_radical/PF01228_21/0_13_NODE_433_length_8455_cov_489_751192_g353_i035382